MLPHSPVIAVYLVGGCVCAMVLQPWIKGQPSLEVPAVAGILLLTVLLMIWNGLLYMRASQDPDPQFPTSTFERYLPAIAATMSFLVGMGLVLFR